MTTPSRPEETEPKFEWVQKDECDILLVHLPGYKRENLKVQVTTSRNLRVLGERKINDKKALRFQKEFSLPNECDINGITAKFEGEVLQVRLPKTPLTAAAAAARMQKEEGKQGVTSSRTTEDDQKASAVDKAGMKDSEQKSKGSTVADHAVEEAKGGAVSKGKSGQMFIGKMIRKKAALLAVIIVAAGVAIALGIGLLQEFSKGNVSTMTTVHCKCEI